jgi:hypothetical protein
MSRSCVILCNGTRVVVERILKRLLVIRIASGPFSGQVETLPRICCDSSGDAELPFTLRRHQFPVKHGWAMTINKSQGQTVRKRLGIYLPAPVFAHGQLYVAFSRAVAFECVQLLVEDCDGDQKRTVSSQGKCKQYTLNIVDHDLLRSACANTVDDTSCLSPPPPLPSSPFPRPAAKRFRHNAPTQSGQSSGRLSTTYPCPDNAARPENTSASCRGL